MGGGPLPALTPAMDLIAKYDVPGPRYTSYPAVPHWSAAPSEEAWLQHLAARLAAGQEQGQGAALYVHIPFCQSLCHYCGCNTVITRDGRLAAPYVDHLLRELRLYTSRLPSIRVDELHLGGGTPTWLPAPELERLLEGISAEVSFSKDAELSVEADPRATQVDHLDALARRGFRRISLGIQDFDAEVQKAVNRHQTEDQVRGITEAARERGFTSINYDLIYGLPRQSVRSIQGTMAAVLRLRPDRIAFYGYAHVPWLKPVQRRFTDADVPVGDGKRALYEEGLRLLSQSGYSEIGIDHFALPEDPLFQASARGQLHRNFMGYTSKQTMPMLGLGVSAIGDSWTAFSQNEKSVASWQARLEKGELPIFHGHQLDAQDLVLRRHILNVMTRFETDWETDLPNAPHLSTLPGRLSELKSDGLVELERTKLRVTEQGRPFVRNVCMALDAHLASSSGERRPTFSRTV